MKKHIPEAHHHSLRLKGYDYPGDGFILLPFVQKTSNVISAGFLMEK
ncbi:MAG: hypothetical protein WCP32_09660 [Bacteroidota bacterium]